MPLLDQPLGQLARDLPGATRLFHDHRLDFCCGGRDTLRQALEQRGLDAESPAVRQLLEALAALPSQSPDERDWRQASPGELIAHILTRYHAVHRAQLDELPRLAHRVERVHAEHSDCPHGLTDHLERMRQEMESHMQKEERILFPMLERGLREAACGPIAMMRHEHDDHGVALEELLSMTHDLEPPEGACNTWHALYAGLREFRDDLMQHIHLENNILFADVEAEVRH